jgi:hypothetical protein
LPDDDRPQFVQTLPVPLDNVERAMVLSRIERMQRLLEDLEGTRSDADRERLRDRLRREMAA